MTTKLSVAEVLSKLEARVKFHQEREAFHGQQEAHHREQRELHASELAAARQNLESFQAVSSAALDFVQQAVAAPAEPAVKPLQGVAKTSGRVMPSRLVRAVAESRGEDEPFGAAAIAQEVNRRFRDKLRRPLSAREVSDTLRRMQGQGLIRLVRPGRARFEALFVRVPRAVKG
jgi:hypothetical protein